MNDNHTQEGCAFEPTDWPARDDRPNHFYHDSLGCPFECTERHNHPVQA
jgi:hypothetical protein